MSISRCWIASRIGMWWTSTSNIDFSTLSGSMPWLIVRLPCGSRSTQRTRWPDSAKATARLSVDVVFATPPFWLAKLITLARSVGASAPSSGLGLQLARAADRLAGGDAQFLGVRLGDAPRRPTARTGARPSRLRARLGLDARARPRPAARPPPRARARPLAPARSRAAARPQPRARATGGSAATGSGAARAPRAQAPGRARSPARRGLVAGVLGAVRALGSVVIGARFRG